MIKETIKKYKLQNNIKIKCPWCDCIKDTKTIEIFENKTCCKKCGNWYELNKSNYK